MKINKYHVEYTKTAVKQLKKMNHYTRLMLIHWISKHLHECTNPYIYGKALKGDLRGLWQYRLGDYRIITEIKDDKLIILVLSIGHRKDIYL